MFPSHKETGTRVETMKQNLSWVLGLVSKSLIITQIHILFLRNVRLLAGMTGSLNQQHFMFIIGVQLHWIEDSLSSWRILIGEILQKSLDSSRHKGS